LLGWVLLWWWVRFKKKSKTQFMELWLQNDGFVQRLVALSQDKYDGIPLELLEILRKDRATQKTKEWMHQIFLGELERTVWTNVDNDPNNHNNNSNAPTTKESLASMQRRLAEQYIPHDIPESKDLSPLLAIFAQGGNTTTNTASTTVEDESIMMAYTSLWSEVLSANLYVAFQDALTVKTTPTATTSDDVKENLDNNRSVSSSSAKDAADAAVTKQRVEHLGRGIRAFLLSLPGQPSTVTMVDLQVLCGGRKITSQALQQVYRFGEDSSSTSMSTTYNETTSQ
jgi:hypothetical protein